MKSRFARRLAQIRADRPVRRLKAEQLLLTHYRMHRELPVRPIIAMIPRRRLYALICRAEIEHRLHIAQLLLQANALRDRVASLLRLWL